MFERFMSMMPSNDTKDALCAAHIEDRFQTAL